MSYREFLKTKEIKEINSGFRIREYFLNSKLFPFQKAIVQWALMRGKAAIFADTGLGKTAMQLEWANQIHNRIKNPILIFAPLAVSKQTKREGEKFGINVNICEDKNDLINGINITNYEKLHKFDNNLGGVIIDESSILKGFDGKFRRTITEFAQKIPYRLACTATPAPNDLMEIINHAEFLGIMKQKEITSLFFIQDGNVTHKWRLKYHAKDDFYKWLASWAVAIKKPSDLGFDDNGFILPKLNQIQVKVNSNAINLKKGQFFSLEAKGLRERQEARRMSIEQRVKKCAEIVNNSNDQFLVWCDLNKESDLLKKSINDSVEVKGSDKDSHKENSVIDFQTGKIKVLISKPSMFGFGLNLQNCNNMVFVGLSDSFEKLYQATRRCWRFGQTKEVSSYIITSELEGDVVKNIENKEKHVQEMMNLMIKNMNLSGQISAKRQEMDYFDNDIIKLPLFMR